MDLIEQLATIENGQARVRLLRRHRELWGAALVHQMYDGVVRLARSDVQQAGRLARAAMWLAHQIGDDGSEAQSLRAMGHVAVILGRHREAVKHYEGALELSRRLGHDVDVARTLNGALQSLSSLG